MKEKILLLALFVSSVFLFSAAAHATGSCDCYNSDGDVREAPAENLSQCCGEAYNEICYWFEPDPGEVVNNIYSCTAEIVTPE